jgi:hypothetical protein
MNTKMRGWIRNQTDMWERRATREEETGDLKIAGVYRSVAREFRRMIRADPWLGRMDSTPTAELMGQQIYESFAAAAHETGWVETKPEEAMLWKDLPEPYKEAMIRCGGDMLASGMIELMVGEAMHRERLETGKRALGFWREFMEDGVSMKRIGEKMKRLAEGYVDD